VLQAATTDPEALPPRWIEVAEHPAFGAAARRFAANILAVADADRTLAAVFKDAGHYVTAMSAAYLDTRGGLTLTLLRQICAATGLLTANRAAALIDFMQHIGVLAPAADQGYRTTPAFRRAWCRHLQAAIEPAAMLDPALAAVAAALEDPAHYQHFLSVQASRLYALASGPDPFPSLGASFLHPLAGCAILHTLALTCTDAAFVPIESASVPLAELSRRFGVSQPHVRRLLKRAEANRFLLHVGPSRRAFHPEGFPTIRYHYAAHLGEMIDCGRLVLAGLADAKGCTPALA
jgi:AraC-like DNA-binding protein